MPKSLRSLSASSRRSLDVDNQTCALRLSRVPSMLSCQLWTCNGARRKMALTAVAPYSTHNAAPYTQHRTSTRKKEKRKKVPPSQIIRNHASDLATLADTRTITWEVGKYKSTQFSRCLFLSLYPSVSSPGPHRYLASYLSHMHANSHAYTIFNSMRTRSSPFPPASHSPSLPSSCAHWHKNRNICVPRKKPARIPPASISWWR